VRRALIAAFLVVALLGVLVGCSQASQTTGVAKAHLAVSISVSEYDAKAQKRISRQYSLDCRPAGGSIPFAARLCKDIARHPLSMLDPPRSRSVCAGAVNGPVVSVSSNWNGRRASFAGEPGCDWPGGTGLAVYWAAVDKDEHALGQFEPRLRCDDDPTLLAKPTPWRSVFACTHGLWTPRTAKLIRIAEQVPPIPGLAPRSLFPQQIGTRRCRILAGGEGVRHLAGSCEVNVTRVWDHPRVSLTENWSAGSGMRRHTWVVTIVGNKGKLTGQRGPVAPQFGV
jgi:hypothetical protein